MSQQQLKTFVVALKNWLSHFPYLSLQKMYSSLMHMYYICSGIITFLLDSENSTFIKSTAKFQINVGIFQHLQCMSVLTTTCVTFFSLGTPRLSLSSTDPLISPYISFLYLQQNLQNSQILAHEKQNSII